MLLTRMMINNIVNKTVDRNRLKRMIKNDMLDFLINSIIEQKCYVDVVYMNEELGMKAVDTRLTGLLSSLVNVEKGKRALTNSLIETLNKT